MICARRGFLLFPVLVMAAACWAPLLPAQEAKESAVFQGRPLHYWVDQATAEAGPGDLDATVAALSEAVLSDDPNAKRDAGDALAALGPKAKAALPALLTQFGHEFPWVRVSCQAAVGALGKEAVPALIEASPEGLNVKGRFESPNEEGPAWAHPVIHQGKLYLRHANSLFCYDLSSE